MKKILIAIDYNPVSEIVANKGYEMAKKMDAEICLLHVTTELRYYGMEYPTFMGYHGADVPFNPELEGEIQRIAHQFLATAKKHLNDDKVQTHLEEGDTAQTILEYSENWGADIIVMGTHSHSAFENLLMGNVANKVVKKTKVPIFLIPVKK